MSYNYVGDVNSNLICCVCRAPFVNPTTTTTCAHTFCKECIVHSLELQPCCPIDRSPLKMADLRPENLLIRNMVDELIVECTHKPTGCQYTCQRQLLVAHLADSCKYVPVACSEEGCNLTVLRKDLGKHVHDCAHRVIVCEGCGTSIKAFDLEVHYAECVAQHTVCPHCDSEISRKELAKHNAICTEYPTLCPHSSHGCSWTGPRRTLEGIHLLQCPYAAISGFFAVHDASVSALRDENTLLRHKLEGMEGAIYALRRDLDVARQALGPWWRPESSSSRSDMQAAETSASSVPSDSNGQFPPALDGITVTTTTTATSAPRSPYTAGPLANGNAGPSRTYNVDTTGRRRTSLSAILASFPDSPVYSTASDDLHEREAPSPVPASPYTDPAFLASYFPQNEQDGANGTRPLPVLFMNPSSPGAQAPGPLPPVPPVPNARSYPPILRYPELPMHSLRNPGVVYAQPSSTSVAPIDLSSTLEGALSSLRRSIVSLSASLDSLSRRHDIALTTENLRMNEEVGALRAIVHGLRMQVHALITERNGTPWGPTTTTSAHYFNHPPPSVQPPLVINSTTSTTKL